MPRSRVRGGRKAHNKRIKKRYEQIKAGFKEQQRIAWEKFQEWKKEQEEKKDNAWKQS